MATTQRRRDIRLAFFALMYSAVLFFSLFDTVVSRFTDDGGVGWFLAFYYFTFQSNFFVCIWLFCFSITRFHGKQSRFARFINNRFLMTAITAYITLTFLVVIFVLAPFFLGYFHSGINGAMLFTHLLTPVVMWIYYFLVPGVGNLKYRHAWYSLIYPITYVNINLIVGALVTFDEGLGAITGLIVPGGPAYAYGFLNPFTYPYFTVFALALIGLCLIFAGLTAVIILFKKYLIASYYNQSDAFCEDASAGTPRTTSSESVKDNISPTQHTKNAKKEKQID
jgi:hypothetical protein